MVARDAMLPCLLIFSPLLLHLPHRRLCRPCVPPQGNPARIVVLSSSAHGYARIHLDDLNCEKRLCVIVPGGLLAGTDSYGMGPSSTHLKGTVVLLSPQPTPLPPPPPTSSYGSGWKMYGESKLANILFVSELAQRLAADKSKVEVFVVHPGEGRGRAVRNAQGSVCTVHPGEGWCWGV